MEREIEGGYRPPPQPTNYLLTLLDERHTIILESIREVKDEIHSIKIDVRTGEIRTRDELLKYIDDRTSPINTKLILIEADVDDLKECLSSTRGGYNWTRNIFEIIISILMLYIALK